MRKNFSIFLCIVAAVTYSLKGHAALCSALDMSLVTFYQMLAMSLFSLFLLIYEIVFLRVKIFINFSFINVANILLLGLVHSMMLLLFNNSLFMYGLSIATPIFYSFPLIIGLIGKIAKPYFSLIDIVNIVYLIGLIFLLYSGEQLQIMDLCITMAPALFNAVYFVLCHQYLQLTKIQLSQYNFAVFIIGVFCILMTGKIHDFDVIQIRPFFYMLLFAVTSYSLTTVSLKYLKADLVSFILVLQMIICVFIGVIFNREFLSLNKIIGLFIIFMSVFAKLLFNLNVNTRV